MVMSASRIILAVVLVLLGWTAAAHAQPGDIVPPRPLDVPDVPYPDGATGNAEVILILAVDGSGAVRSAEVQVGEEPFASAARAASSGWRFTPATRDGEPIAAKIRFRVSFVEELEDPYPDPDPDSPYAPAAPAAPDPYAEPDPLEEGPFIPGVIDVTVEGEPVKHPPSVSSFTRAEVRQLPGAFGDPFRAIEVLPGVTPVVSGLPFFYVRGAPPGNIGYYLDGVRVPYLFHVAAGPSVVHPAIVERVDLYAGGYPARFGRYSGAIVSAETTEPNPDWRGEGSLRIVDAGALVEGGFADGRGTALLGGRYSYTALIISLLAPEVTVDYRDFQGRASYDITPRDRVSLFTFGSYDYLSNTQTVDGEDIETVLFGAEFYRVDGRYDARLRGGGKLRAAATWGFDQTRLFGTRNSQSMLFGSRLNVTQPLSPALTLRGGLNVQLDRYTADELPWADPDNPVVVQFNNLFPPRVDTAVAGWADVVWKPTKHLEVTPGIRVDTYISEGEKAVAPDPRLAVVAHASDDLRFLHALGVANQPPAFVVPVPGLAVASLRGGLQRAIQASSGVEIDLPEKVTASVTGFTGVYLNMTDAIGSQQRPRENELIPRSLGSAKGIEVYLRRSLTERLGGFVSYTFSRTTRSVGSERFVASFDRPHVLNTAFGYRIGGGWQAGLRFSLYSGAPLVQEDSEEAESDPETGETTQAAETSERLRDPLFYRLDFRVEKRWSLSKTGWIAVVAEMINATLNKETLGGNRVGPVAIPSLGLEGGF